MEFRICYAHIFQWRFAGRPKVENFGELCDFLEGEGVRTPVPPLNCRPSTIIFLLFHCSLSIEAIRMEWTISRDIVTYGTGLDKFISFRSVFLANVIY